MGNSKRKFLANFFAIRIHLVLEVSVSLCKRPVFLQSCNLLPIYTSAVLKYKSNYF